MPTESKLDLATEVRVFIAEHAHGLGVNRASLNDVRARALAALPRLTSTGEIAMPGGRSLAEWIALDLRRDAPHLFNPKRPPSEPVAAPTPNPRDLKPGDRLALANGDRPAKL
ncbi:MAG: hypothetical protein ACM3YN_00965 [Parcubacteria group bacterium]